MAQGCGYGLPHSPPGLFVPLAPPGMEDMPAPWSGGEFFPKGGIDAPPGLFEPDAPPALPELVTSPGDVLYQQFVNDMMFYDSLLMPWYDAGAAPCLGAMPMQKQAKAGGATNLQKKKTGPTAQKKAGVMKKPDANYLLQPDAVKVDVLLDYFGGSTHASGTSESSKDSRKTSEDGDDATVGLNRQETAASECTGMSTEGMNVAIANLDGSNAENRDCVLQSVSDTFWSLALHKRGCHVVQKAIDVGSAEYRMKLLENMRGRVFDTLKSPHGNYVLQKFIKMVPPKRIQFIVDELDQHVLWVARHRFGCRVLQRLLEQCEPDQTEPIINKMVEDCASLSKHAFGSFVLQQILQHGSADDRSALAKYILTDIMQLSKHRLGTHIVVCALAHCSEEDVQAFTEALRRDPDQFYQLSQRAYGSFVVKEVNRITRSNRKNAEQLTPENTTTL